MYDPYLLKNCIFSDMLQFGGVTLNVLFCALLFSFKIPYEHLTTLL